MKETIKKITGKVKNGAKAICEGAKNDPWGCFLLGCLLVDGSLFATSIIVDKKRIKMVVKNRAQVNNAYQDGQTMGKNSATNAFINYLIGERGVSYEEASKICDNLEYLKDDWNWRH